MGQGYQSVGGVKVALKAAIVGFKRPEGQQHAAINAIVALDPVKDTVISFPICAAPVDAVV